MTARTAQPTDWHVAINGTGPAPWFVTRRPVDGSLRPEYARNAKGRERRFKTAEAAQKVADKLQVAADLDDAREYARLATHHLIRATDGLEPDDPLLGVLERLSAIYLDLTGRTL